MTLLSVQNSLAACVLPMGGVGHSPDPGGQQPGGRGGIWGSSVSACFCLQPERVVWLELAEAREVKTFPGEPSAVPGRLGKSRERA